MSKLYSYVYSFDIENKTHQYIFYSDIGSKFICEFKLLDKITKKIPILKDYYIFDFDSHINNIKKYDERVRNTILEIIESFIIDISPKIYFIPMGLDKYSGKTRSRLFSAWSKKSIFFNRFGFEFIELDGSGDFNLLIILKENDSNI